MPHDRNGQPLQEGDLVTVTCRVTAVQPGIEYCNVNLETVEPMYPGNSKSGLTLNGKQVCKVQAEDIASGQDSITARNATQPTATAGAGK